MGPFVQVVLGQIISLFGNAALRFVLPLILLRQTGSAAVYGAATALALLPALAGTLAGGVLADRCRKARLMVVLDLAAAGLALVLQPPPTTCRQFCGHRRHSVRFMRCRGCISRWCGPACRCCWRETALCRAMR